MTTTNWSWSQLVGEHGEEAALALLQYQPGLGAFKMYVTPKETSVSALRGVPERDLFVTATRHPPQYDGPWDVVHDEIERRTLLPPPSILDLLELDDLPNLAGHSFTRRAWAARKGLTGLLAALEDARRACGLTASPLDLLP